MELIGVSRYNKTTDEIGFFKNATRRGEKTPLYSYTYGRQKKFHISHNAVSDAKRARILWKK